LIGILQHLNFAWRISVRNRRVIFLEVTMTAQEHNRLLSIFFFIQGGLQVIVGLAIGIIYGGLGSIFMASGRTEQDQMMGGLFVVLGIAVGLVLLVFAAFTLFTANKVRKVQAIGRTLGIVISILSLFSFPLGTALGVYGLWFFFGDLGKALYGSPVENYSPNYSPPPPPNSWQ
jgi:hypothetical protein